MTADSEGQTPKRDGRFFNITASLDHLDYDCVVVAGGVHVLGSVRSGHFTMKSKRTFTFCESVE